MSSPRLTFLFVLFCLHAYGQTKIKGTFLDSLTKQPIAFVNIVLADGKSGTTSDIEGSFEMIVPTLYEGPLTISHISYKKKTFSIIQLRKQEIILLAPNTTLLKELSFTAEENPALRIIRNAIANKKENDPENLRSYQYISYNKFMITVSQPSAKTDSLIARLKERPDTVKLKKEQKSLLSFDSLVQQSHLFLSESVTEKKVIRPNLDKEKLLALKVSGFKSPLFTNVATDYQPFTFYKDQLSLLGKDYVNPLAKGTFSRYDFYLVDTSYIDADTVFIIQYQPKPKTFFPGLTGILSITNKDFAIKNVIASSADSLALMKIRIRQNYEKINGHWFPVQLNTDIDLVAQKIFGRYMIIRHRSFLKEIQINPLLNRTAFGDIKTDLTVPGEKENTATLTRFRNFEPDKKEARTYTLLDSALRKARTLEKIIEGIATQSVPLGKLEFDLNKFAKVNKYEKFRLGAGIYTSPLFSKWIRLGGYAGYGFGDHRWKYGGEVKFNLNPNKDFYFRLSYTNDIYETGSSHEPREGLFIRNESFRTLVGKQFDRIEMIKGEASHRIFADLHGSLFLMQGNVSPTYNYQLQFNGDLLTSFKIAETGVMLRYVRSENYMNLNGKKIFIGSRYPSVTFTVAKALNIFDARNFEYTYLDLSARQQVKHRSGTKSYISLSAGWVNGLAPYGRLYNGRGANGAGFYVENHFQTMGLYEFTSSRYASLFLNHNFGNVLLNKRFSKPELLVYHNMGIGFLDNAQSHFTIPVKSFDKGFYESGAGLNNLLRINYLNIAYLGLGGGVFYRYGTYSLPTLSDNLAWRLNLGITF